MSTSSGPSLNGVSDFPLLRGGECRGQESEALARLTVSLPRNLYRQFRLHALDQDMTLSALMVRLIREELG